MNKKILSLIIVALLVVGGIVVGFMIFKGQDETVAEEPKQEEVQPEKTEEEKEQEHRNDLITESREVVKKAQEVYLSYDENKMKETIESSWLLSDEVMDVWLGMLEDNLKQEVRYTSIKVDFLEEKVVGTEDKSYITYTAKTKTTLVDENGKETIYNDHMLYNLVLAEDGTTKLRQLLI